MHTVTMEWGEKEKEKTFIFLAFLPIHLSPPQPWVLTDAPPIITPEKVRLVLKLILQLLKH